MPTNLLSGERKLVMPDPKKLRPSERAKLLGCVKAKNQAWKKKNKKNTVPSDVNQKHFADCSRALGYH